MLSMLFLINIIYLAQNVAINKSQQHPTNPNQNHILVPALFLSSTSIFKFFKTINSVFQILTGFLSRYFSKTYFIFPSSVGTCISPLQGLVLI